MTTSNLSLAILINAVDSASSVLGGVGSAIAGIGIAAVTTAAQAVQMAAGFQTSTTKIASYAGLSGQALDQMNNSLMQMAVQVGQTPTQLADALYPIVSSGYSASQALNILRLSAETAASSGADTTVVANGLTTALKSFNLPASDAGAVMDVMNKTVAQGNMQFPQYAAVIGKLSLSASSAHVSFNEMNAALSVLTVHGFPSAAQAATAAGNLYTEMGVKTDALAQHAKSLGISFNEQKFSADSLSQKIAYLSQVTGGNQGELLKLLGGSTLALKAFNALKGGADDYSKALKGNQTAQGTTAQIFANTSATFNQSVARLNAAFQVLMIAIGNKLLPVLGQLAGAITPLIVAFANWVAGSGQANGAMQTIGALLQGLFLPLWQQLVTLFQTQLVPMWGQFRAALAPIMPALQQVAQFVGLVLFEAFATLITIIRATIGAFSGLLTGVALVVQGMVTYIQGGFQFIGGLIQLFVDLFTMKWSNLGTDLGNISGGIVKMFQGMWQAIAGIFVSAINGLIGLVNGWLQGMISGINAVLSAAHQATISMPSIPMLSAPAVAAGNFSNPLASTASQAQGVTPAQQAQSNAGLAGILSQLQSLGSQQGQQNLIQQANAANTGNIANTANNLNNTTVPAAANTAAAASKAGHAKTAAQIAKAADTANAQNLRLSADQQKAITASDSPAVQALVNQSKAAAAQGNTATAAVYAQQADTLAAQQKAATVKAAQTAATAAHHKAVLAAAAERKAQASKNHAEIMAAKAAATKAKAAAKVAKATLTAARHKQTIQAILNAANQVSGATSPQATAVIAATAAGVILPDYLAGTAYTATNAQSQAAATASPTTINVTVNSSTAEPKEHGKKVADEVNRQLARHLKQGSIAPRYTHGGTHK